MLPFDNIGKEMKMRLQLNCDMGEGFGIYQMGLDEHIMPYIDMANLACGFHAGDPLTMSKSVALAVQHGVAIGAHPAYPDLVGFGRRDMQCSAEEIEAMILYQIGALDTICQVHDTKVHYVKPHGALYNTMMRDETTFKAILKAIHKYDTALKLMILATGRNAYYQSIADDFGVSLLFEAFADRAYTKEGSLVPRSSEGAVLHDVEEIVERVKCLTASKTIKSIEGEILYLNADTICVHGDNKEALSIIKALHGLNHAL
jgi:UPF0271 protein